MQRLIFSLVAAGAVMLATQLGAVAQVDTTTPAPPPQAPPPQRQPVQNPVVPGGVIEPGDQLNVQVFGDQTLTQQPIVQADGSIAYPLAGRIPVAGKTPDAAATAIRTALEKYVKHPYVTVSIAQAGEENVLVLGGVKVPGKYQIRSGGRLSDAIAAAGGLGETNGDLPEARITQANGSVKDVSLQKLYHDGDGALNTRLQNNAVVYVVTPNAFTVEVVGAVDRPGNVQLQEGDRLSMAIARAGTSPNVYSDLNHVVVTRTDANGKTTKREINMYKALENGDRRYDPVLEKNDVVYVPMGRRPTNAVLDPLSLIGRLIGL